MTATRDGHDIAGPTSGRPTNCEIGHTYFDTTLGMMLTWNGTAWVGRKWYEKTVTAALLDSAGSVAVVPASTADSFLIRGVNLVGGGTNFGAGGNRLIDLTDGTTVYTQIANADIESAPSATLPWGNAKVPQLTDKASVPTVAGAALRFQYSGGTTDHSTGSIKFQVEVEKVA